MKIVYLSNFFNHHQKPLSDALYKATDGNYWFIETSDMPMEQRLLGYQRYSEPYILRYDTSNRRQIDMAIMEADAVIYGEAPLRLIKKRVAKGLLTFRDDERRYKSIYKYLKWPIYTYKSLTLNKCYLLCASAFAARDYRLSGMNIDKCYKWGYFPEVKNYDNVDVLIENKSFSNGKVLILWACRMIGWKHPEAPVCLAKRLKEQGVRFQLKMIGRGPKEREIKDMIRRDSLEDCVEMLGPMNPEEVRSYMEKADIFLLTSDKHEGWGATLNESMNSACAVVASHAIGSVPFLLENGKNGLIYKSGDEEDLFRQVMWLMSNPVQRKEFGKTAYMTMKKIWNAENACKNLMKLINALTSKKDTPIDLGPCSKVTLMNDNWWK